MSMITETWIYDISLIITISKLKTHLHVLHYHFFFWFLKIKSLKEPINKMKKNNLYVKILIFLTI